MCERTTVIFFSKIATRCPWHNISLFSCHRWVEKTDSFWLTCKANMHRHAYVYKVWCESKADCKGGGYYWPLSLPWSTFSSGQVLIPESDWGENVTSTRDQWSRVCMSESAPLFKNNPPGVEAKPLVILQCTTPCAQEGILIASTEKTF